jgi:PAS domain S-box-containing protein
MKIYTKILITILPLVIVSLVASSGSAYLFSRNALTSLAETWLQTKLDVALKSAEEHEEILHRYGLAEIAASVSQSKFDTAADMQSIEIGDHGYIFVVNSDGIIRIHPDSSVTGSDVSKENWFLSLGKQAEGRLVYSMQNERHLAMWAYFKPWGWYILAADTEIEIYGAINRMRTFILLLGTMGPLLIALVLMLVTRRLTTPLCLLEAGAVQIGQGNLDTRISIRTKDEVGSLASVFNDMTAQLQETLDALQSREEYFRTIIENASDVISIVDKDGNIRYASPSSERVFGFNKEERIGSSIFEHVHPDDRANVQNYFSSKLDTPGLAPPIEFRYHKVDGSWLFLETIGNNLLHNPVMDGVVIYTRNITERKRAEEALEAERERLAVTLRSIGDGVITIDMEGTIVLINKMAEKLTGWDHKEAIGKPLLEVFKIIEEEKRQSYENLVKTVLDKERMITFTTPMTLMAKDGLEHIIADSAAPIFDIQSRIIGAVIVFRDISEKLMMEKELLKTQRLEAVGILAGGIAHDFNNILTAVTGNISLVKHYTNPGDKIHDRIIEVEKALERAVALTFQLLTFAKGGTPVKKTLLISKLIKDSAVFTLRGSNVQCEFSLDDNLQPVYADEGHLNQVINNLIINAKQAMPEGGVIKIAAENVTIKPDKSLPLNPGDYIIITIEDEGCGIAEENISKIFDPYFTTKDDGSGLGLATTYSIIQQHGGHITVESKPGVGTKFQIHIPTSKKSLQEKATPRNHIYSSGGRILVMEDEAAIRNVTEVMLDELGYESDFACDGEEAIEKYKNACKSEKPFDAVLMDLTIAGGRTP